MVGSREPWNGEGVESLEPTDRRAKYHARCGQLGVVYSLSISLIDLDCNYHAVLSAFSPSFLIVSSRITNFWILPVMVIGNSGTNSM